MHAHVETRRENVLHVNYRKHCVNAKIKIASCTFVLFVFNNLYNIVYFQNYLMCHLITK